jgi:hypothetical protein
MKESIQIALEIYFLAFAIGLSIAGLIKGMHGVIRRFSHENEK